jgi:hypothetical protein
LPAKVVRLGLILEYCSCSDFKVALQAHNKIGTRQRQAPVTAVAKWTPVE